MTHRGDLWPCFNANQLEKPYNELLITARISDIEAGPLALHIGRSQLSPLSVRSRDALNAISGKMLSRRTDLKWMYACRLSGCSHPSMDAALTGAGWVEVPLKEVITKRRISGDWDLNDVPQGKVSMELQWLPILEGAS
jgi:hypothetical protein